jgi:hypothetical protein
MEAKGHSQILSQEMAKRIIEMKSPAVPAGLKGASFAR